MPTFELKRSWSQRGVKTFSETVIVEANSKEEAVDRANDEEFATELVLRQEHWTAEDSSKPEDAEWEVQ